MFKKKAALGGAQNVRKPEENVAAEQPPAGRIIFIPAHRSWRKDNRNLTVFGSRRGLRQRVRMCELPECVPLLGPAARTQLVGPHG